MARLAGENRSRLLLPREAVEDYFGPDNPVQFIDAFVDDLDLEGAGRSACAPEGTGRVGVRSGRLPEALNLWVPKPLHHFRRDVARSLDVVIARRPALYTDCREPDVLLRNYERGVCL